jgi:hypothetical protein
MRSPVKVLDWWPSASCRPMPECMRSTARTRRYRAAGRWFALAGRDASLLSARRVSSDVGAYALSGQDATLAYGRVVVSDVGAYALSGQDAGLVYSGTATLEPMAPVYVPRDRRSWSAGYGPIAFEATSTLLWVVPRARHTTTEDQ